MNRFTPANCPHCEYDRRFPETDMGGWLYFGNNGPYVSCPVCNNDGSHERISAGDSVFAFDPKLTDGLFGETNSNGKIENGAS